MNRLKPYHIRQLIFEGEEVSLDFKKTITSCSKIAKTMVAFANNKGGRLLVGVSDNGDIKGVRSEDEEKYMLTKAAHFYCRPALEPYFEEVYIEDKIVLVAEIKESDTKPHYALGEDNKWWVYIRVKDKSLLASKIVVDVLKASSREDGVLIEYSGKEKALLEYLESNERITASEYSKMLNLSRRRTRRILVNLVLSGIIRVHTTEKEEFYTAS
ncbi:winged helix-turn-helix DNA-binding protein [Arcticibacter tournemirensis]|uniref:Winged helix-turn-helix transcriptional regulator n=1 Tax=Arcticibacter tournemirensis TaxID=699437 RepID=A0A5M9GXK6_9SPHI|nr:RNA-binding domain-containing protein [Arcticibacter tournemirensis]KAA8478521.1 winged helix-turn-helix transcriptional regulator [Arcticibacter tournemirensis]TQM51132.1 winged helix-turn-helix DNA-binding protein [Arcticibacter tournemirensis]